MKRRPVHALRAGKQRSVLGVTCPECIRAMTDDEILLRIMSDPAKRQALAERLAGAVVSVVGAKAAKRVRALTKTCDTALKAVHAEATDRKAKP